MDPADEYAMWCELHPCPVCDGLGEDAEFGRWPCVHCVGTGIDPDAEYDGPGAI